MSTLSREMGTHWLYELMYGAEKAYQLNGANSFRSTAQDERLKLARKLEVARYTIAKPIGSDAEVTLLDANAVGSIEGRISEFDLNRATITLHTGNRITDFSRIGFCAIEFDEKTQMISTTELIQLSVDTAYDY